LSKAGENGFKKSFRHDLLVPRYAVVDPQLLVSCPRALIAANGMDALTQLLESYVSIRANPVTDALAVSGLEAIRDSLLGWYESGPGGTAECGRMAYAALLSGITLAQVGLGSVHGLAAPLGAYFPIPHGVACGTLIAEATKMNILALEKRDRNSPALEKYARAGRVLCGRTSGSDEAAREALVHLLENWSERMQLPKLGAYGVGTSDLERVVANCRGSSMKTNPVVLDDNEVREILARRL